MPMTYHSDQPRKIGTFNVPSKKDVSDAYVKINDEIGTDLHVLNDPFRHSLALMEITQTVLKMNIEVAEHIKQKGITDKSKASYARLQRLLKLTLDLNNVGDINMDYKSAGVELLMQSRAKDLRIEQLEKELENSRKAYEEADSNEV